MTRAIARAGPTPLMWYLGSSGKIDNGIVVVRTLWADEQRDFPVHAEPYTPARRLLKGQADPAFRTKPRSPSN